MLDEGQYLCSTRTMYRVLSEDGASRERRDQLTHPAYQKPELLATAPNQLWSWDITKLRGSAKWTYFYLYVILDVFSRYVVGWMVAPREGAGLASKLIEETCQKQIILPGQLTIHADRGSSMRSACGLPAGRSPHHQDPQPALHFQRQSVFGKPVPHDEVSSRVSGRSLRLHSGQPRLLPAVLRLVQRRPSSLRHRNDDARHNHYGRAPLIREKRQTVLDAAYLAHPDRFVRRPPIPLQLPKEVWINKTPKLRRKYSPNSTSECLQTH